MESTADRPNRMMIMMLVETDLWLNSPLLSLHNTVSGHLSCFNRQFAGRAWFQDSLHHICELNVRMVHWGLSIFEPEIFLKIKIQYSSAWFSYQKTETFDLITLILNYQYSGLPSCFPSLSAFVYMEKTKEVRDTFLSIVSLSSQNPTEVINSAATRTTQEKWFFYRRWLTIWTCNQGFLAY